MMKLLISLLSTYNRIKHIIIQRTLQSHRHRDNFVVIALNLKY